MKALKRFLLILGAFLEVNDFRHLFKYFNISDGTNDILPLSRRDLNCFS